MIFKDKTYCASPNCQNKCGRKMTDSERIELANYESTVIPIGYAYFCDENGEVIEVDTIDD